ncbi:hypothetical protein T440DRAFT_422357 [Plenodomus tracheiphilus IPT5]|uniref:YMC020W-like alpha/beta hydrolase domain-containing protein n=1 Tax=Plenodomus tracheiphilus IPT5 TaxID=1408161 RepID=A0A6A7BC51_9PLEO|nr:hypothetical protein T440DRAFT_422357 [Plenodomus tracheiphilus IPT5]
MKRPLRLLPSFARPTGMVPRKKSKPNAEAPADDSSSARSDVAGDAHGANPPLSTPSASEVLRNAPSAKSLAASTATASSATPPATPGTHTPKGKKWLSGSGSWRSKAPAIVKTATESIGVTGGATGELPGDEAKKPRDDSPKRFLTKRKSSKGDVIPASITQVSVSTGGMVDEAPTTKPEETQNPDERRVDEPPLPPEPSQRQPNTAANTWAWRSWWSRPDGYSEANKARSAAQDSVENAQSTPLPGPTPSEEPDMTTKGLGSTTISNDKQAQDSKMREAPAEPVSGQNIEMPGTPTAANDTTPRVTSSGSWFRLWSSAQNAKSSPVPKSDTPNDPAPRLNLISEATPGVAPETQPAQEVASTTESTMSAETTQSPAPPQGASKSSAWAFWYRGGPGDDNKPAEGGAQKHVGEVAVMDTPSQSHPEAAQFNEQEQSKADAQKESPPPKAEPITKRSFASLRGRPKSQQTIKEAKATPKSSETTTPTKTSPVVEPIQPESASAAAAQPTPKQAAKGKSKPTDLVLPEFGSTYKMVQQPSFWKQVRQYFLGGEPAAPHLHINPAPPRIKKAVAIGVHGFFPAPIIQKVLGQPTGTSIRFANAAAAAIKDWSEARGYSPEIEQIALEGEGFVAERVNSLWKLLLNWIDHIKAADFILVACHSQGVPVAMMLVAKLIQFGCVNATRIGVCAMAGVNMGPFIEYKTKYFGPTAAELFEFSDPKSLVSQMYLAALDEVLRFGVRILYVGSIDDQLVSLESSTFSTLSHPYIYRAVFVDGRIHAPDFLTHLIGFALKLRNLGLPDHGLIRELSPALAGSLYGGEGHSRVYEDPAVYTLAVQHALETTSLPIPPQQRPSTSGSFQGIQIPVVGGKQDVGDLYKLRVREYEPSASSVNANPFFLPWAMRGLLEEEFVKRELEGEVEELLGLFEKWKPVSKGLKDVKFRLEGVRSKL